MQRKFDFEQINLIPRLGIVDSRSECSTTSVNFGKHEFKLPIVPANMECVISEELAIKLAKSGYFYIMHRFEVNSFEFVRKMKSLNLISSISVGVNSDSYLLIDDFFANQIVPDYITIDIAHGHCLKMERMLKYIKSKLPETFVIAGNISSKEGVMDLQSWGADSLKVGIGPGSACTTWPSTGFGSRNCQASTIFECSKVATVPIIADGGIKVPADITKSIVLGATMVMIGGMLSGFSDSPGDLINSRNGTYKEFWGSASVYQSGKKNRIEGTQNLIPYKAKSIFDELSYLEECLQSSISYGGGRDLSCLNSVQWI
jgi:GMP reductase